MAIGSPGEFDDWAEHYDAAVCGSDLFPFRGYDEVLRRLVDLAGVRPGTTVLDLGVGTGNLARQFAARGCQVWGIDFSARMLALARAKLPDVRLAQLDILDPWPVEFCRRYDRVVSAYVFHHLERTEKVDLLARLTRDHCTENARILVADIAFPTSGALDRARVRWADVWDEEHYWIVDRDLSACARAGLDVSFEPVTDFSGVFTLSTSRPSASPG